VFPANIGEGLEVVGGARGSADRYPRQYVGCRRTGDGGRRNLLIDDRVGFCVSYAKVELFGFGPPVAGHDDEAGELRCPMETRHRQSVLQHDGEVVALPQAQCSKSVDYSANFGIPLGVAETPVAVYHSECRRAALDSGDKAAAKVKHPGGLLLHSARARPKL